MDKTVSRGVTSISDKVVAVDFETFYDSKSKYSLKNLDPFAYTHHKKFDAYLVSILGEGGAGFVGRPEDFCWSTLDGALLVAHNAAFDGLVLNRLIELGVVPEFKREWVDTTDLVSYLNRKRSLKDAAHYLLGIEVSKAVRSSMDGRNFSDALTAGDGKALLDYAMDDAILCLKLWKDYGHLWPKLERDISKNFRESGWRGIRVDQEALAAGLKKLRGIKNHAESLMPWVNPDNPKDARPSGSTGALAAYARGLGIEVPHSFAKDAPEMKAWIAKYSDKYPVIGARLDLASVNTHIARLESMEELIDANGCMHFSLVCHGAHTGRSTAGVRDIGDSSMGKDDSPKFNPLNLSGDLSKTFGVDMKGMLIPRKGHVFGSWDFGQIEARVIQWLAGNSKFLSLVDSIGNIYEADAVNAGLWNPDNGDLKSNNKSLYQVSKRKILALGFGMGTVKFLDDCRKFSVDIGGVPKDEWNLDTRLKFIIRNQAGIDWKDSRNEREVGYLIAADRIVRSWRNDNQLVVGFWKAVQDCLTVAAMRKDSIYEFELPSGRVKRFFNPRVERVARVSVDPDTGKESTKIEDQLYASVVEGQRAVHLYGGKIAQNLVQATARDIMFQGAMDVVYQTGWAFLFDVYDSVIFEIPEGEAEKAISSIPHCLCKGSHTSWTKGLPLTVEGCDASQGGNGITRKYI
jgi:hypothetical protein